MLPTIKKTLITAFVASSVLGVQVTASQADIDAEIARYIDVFNTQNHAVERLVMNKLVWAGYSSESLYDVIATKLESVKNADDKESKRQASWYAKTLSMSGNEKYRAVLQDVATNSDNKKVRERAAAALDRLALYKVWNPIISAGLEQAPAGLLEETRVKNMLTTNEHELLRIGVKRLYYAHLENTELVNLAKQRLASEWRLVDESNDFQLDSVAWLIKTIGAAGDASVIPLLEEIQNGSDIKKVKKYAKKTIKILQSN